MKTWRVFVWGPGEKNEPICRYDGVEAETGQEAKEKGIQRARAEGLDVREASVYQEIEGEKRPA